MEQNIYNSKEFKRSRTAYTSQAAIEYFISILAADAFLANLLTRIGISDALTGIISSFISLAFVIQLFTIFIEKKVKNVPMYVIVLDTVSSMLFLMMYTVPFIRVGTLLKSVLVTAFILFAYITKYLESSVYFKWANSFVAPNKRGEFSAIKEIISLLGGIVFSFVIGKIVDAYNAANDINGSFVFLTIVMLVLNIANLISFLMISRRNVADESEEVHGDTPIKEIFKNTLGNKSFLKVMLMTVLWFMGRYVVVGFLGTYKTKELMISVGTVQVINIAANLARAAVSVPMGKFSDKKSFAMGMSLGYLIEFFAFLTLIFTTPSTRWLIVGYTVLYNVGFAALNANSFNIVYSYVDMKYIVPAMAINNSVGGLCGFLASLVASKLISGIQANGNTFLGFNIYGQQVLGIIATVLTLIALLYTYFIIGKEKVKKQ